MAKQPRPGNDVESSEPEIVEAFDFDARASIASMGDAIALVNKRFGEVVAAHETPELGDGFRIASDDEKERLCGVPLMFLSWVFRPGDFDEEYVSCRVISQDGSAVRKWLINDGGTGICKELRAFQNVTGRTGGLFVKNGLRMSKYHIDAETREPLSRHEFRLAQSTGRKTIPAATFYLDSSA